MSEMDEIKARVEGHTPGPWEVESMDSGHSRYETDFWITAGDAGDTVCGMDGLSRATLNERVARNDGKADAELIAAAPKLLAALEAVEALHYVAEDYNFTLCNECGDSYPCPTIKAITEALQ